MLTGVALCNGVLVVFNITLGRHTVSSRCAGLSPRPRSFPCCWIQGVPVGDGHNIALPLEPVPLRLAAFLPPFHPLHAPLLTATLPRAPGPMPPAIPVVPPAPSASEASPPPSHPSPAASRVSPAYSLCVAPPALPPPTPFLSVRASRPPHPAGPPRPPAPAPALELHVCHEVNGALHYHGLAEERVVSPPIGHRGHGTGHGHHGALHGHAVLGLPYHAHRVVMVVVMLVMLMVLVMVMLLGRVVLVKGVKPAAGVLWSELPSVLETPHPVVTLRQNISLTM